MNIKMNNSGGELTVAVEGRLDTLTSPALKEKLELAIGSIGKLVFDFTELKYISSAGLRVLLTAMQIMEEQGGMVVRNVSPEVMSVFEVTGFSNALNFE